MCQSNASIVCSLQYVMLVCFWIASRRRRRHFHHLCLMRWGFVQDPEVKCIAFQWPKAKVAGAWSGMGIEGYRSVRLYMRLIVCT